MAEIFEIFDIAKYESICKDDTLNEHLGCVEDAMEGALSTKRMKGGDEEKAESAAEKQRVQGAGVRAIRRNAGSATRSSNQGSSLRCTIPSSMY